LRVFGKQPQRGNRLRLRGKMLFEFPDCLRKRDLVLGQFPGAPASQELRYP
jgi:hypothetical protein